MIKGEKKASKTDNRLFLIQHGMKDKLVEKLKDTQIKNLASFAMDNLKSSNLLQILIQLASMEIRGKSGAAFLAAHNIATVIQLKNLAPEQITRVLDEFEATGDETSARRNVKNMLIDNQQEKLYFKSGGIKGEYYLFRGDTNHKEDIL